MILMNYLFIQSPIKLLYVCGCGGGALFFPQEITALSEVQTVEYYLKFHHSKLIFMMEYPTIRNFKTVKPCFDFGIIFPDDNSFNNDFKHNTLGRPGY